MAHSRRDFLWSLTAAGAAVMPTVGGKWRPRWEDSPFGLGVASGDPRADGVVIWTRLVDAVPLVGDVSVRWEVAEDDQFRRIAASGTTAAIAALGHSVHVELVGLRPDRWYWYRFTQGSAVSPVGRTRTWPLASSSPERFRMIVASCQHYEHGTYAAHAHIATEEADLVAFLGDYIYESTTPARRRSHGAGEPETLDEYRARYALYKSDPLLQAAHAACPWIVTWDDHEVDNNYTGAVPQDNVPIAQFLRRRAAAYQAYYEHMPLRRSSLPVGPNALLYRSGTFGKLVSVHTLDGRQYRDDQACGDGRKPVCPEWERQERTMLGAEQERWLSRGLVQSRATWNLIAQQVMFAPFDVDPSPEGQAFAMDNWNGYPGARDRLLGVIDRGKVPNVVVITGDIHASYASEIPRDYRKAGSPSVATEYVCTSISSDGDGSDVQPQVVRAMSGNPWMKYHGARRGYIRCDVTPQEWRADFRVLQTIQRSDAPVSTAASFVTPTGSARVERAR